MGLHPFPELGFFDDFLFNHTIDNFDLVGTPRFVGPSRVLFENFEFEGVLSDGSPKVYYFYGPDESPASPFGLDDDAFVVGLGPNDGLSVEEHGPTKGLSDVNRFRVLRELASVDAENQPPDASEVAGARSFFD